MNIPLWCDNMGKWIALFGLIPMGYAMFTYMTNQVWGITYFIMGVTLVVFGLYMSGLIEKFARDQLELRIRELQRNN